MRDRRLIEYARANRREMTEPERKLWHQLRGKRFQGIKFRRQNVLGRYIADFYSREVMLVVEVDGDTHAFQNEYDRIRKTYMIGLGFRVIRFANSEIMTNIEGVLIDLAAGVAEMTPSHPTLPPKGERAI